jgi:tyrosine-protein kinase Etk/Wzc
MNARWLPPPPAAPANPEPEGPYARLKEHVDILIDNRWQIAAITAVVLALGATYALFAPRVYESNVLIQVEDAERSAGSLVGDPAVNGMSTKMSAAGETEILKSRMVLEQAIDNTRLYISARPRYLPLVGAWLARRASGLSDPGLLGMGGYVSGTERIAVAQMDVPEALEGSRFVLTAGPGGSYTLSHPKLDKPLAGQVGQPLDAQTPRGPIHLLVGSFAAKPGAEFELVRHSKQLVLLDLQNDLRVIEKGKQSSVVDVSWQSEDRAQLTDLLNEVARLYVRQNIDQKTTQAERALNFLDTELPKLKRQLERSEDAYNKYRNENGTISLDDEARNALTQSMDLQTRLLDARQKRLDLMDRFTGRDPSVMTLDTQISYLKRELGGVEDRIRRMPMLQQNSMRMQRDIKVNTDLYASLLNSSLQMRIAKEGKIGNVRVLDQALLPEKPVRPKAAIVMGLALLVGLFIGSARALVRKSWKSTVASPAEIEAYTGLDVYSTVALSNQQRTLDRAIGSGTPGVKVLAAKHPDDPALEGLRRLRTALKFVMLGAPNNRILISSATPGAGKTFVSANFAVVLASTGKRVLLIDADLRRSSLSRLFGLDDNGGLTGLVDGKVPLEKAIHARVLPNLDVMTAGAAPADPASFLTSDAFVQVLTKLSARYDAVIVDAPPMLLASDTAEMAPWMGTLLMVARAGDSELGDLSESAKRLAQVGARFHGIVFNALDTRRRHYGSYSYGYGVYRFRGHDYPALEGAHAVSAGVSP